MTVVWPRGTEDRVIDPGVLMTEFLAQGFRRQSSWPRGTDKRVLDPGVLMTEYLAQGY